MSAGDEDDDDESRMPLLVYVSREKRRASPHHFKAGALNALLRVSSLVSNAPFVLVLDCDMSCNSRASALEAMCFHLDRRGTPDNDLAFVQFPQMFHNLSRNDIYTNDLRFYLYPTIPGQFPGSEPRRQPLSAVRSSARTVRILCFPVILHKSPRTSPEYNPPFTLLCQIFFRIAPRFS